MLFIWEMESAEWSTIQHQSLATVVFSTLATKTDEYRILLSASIVDRNRALVRLHRSIAIRSAIQSISVAIFRRSVRRVDWILRRAFRAFLVELDSSWSVYRRRRRLVVRSLFRVCRTFGRRRLRYVHCLKTLAYFQTNTIRLWSRNICTRDFSQMNKI